MHLVELTEYLIKSLVKDPEMVSVKKFETGRYQAEYRRFL